MSEHATATPELTQARLRELLHYDPETGIFTWRVRRKSCPLGGRAGSQTDQGYRRICVDAAAHKEHRLAFLYMTGAMPNFEIDHINRVRDDNRWANLRIADRKINCTNVGAKSESKSGIRGVHFYKRDKKWQSQISSNGKKRHLGYFDQMIEAKAAYDAALEAKMKNLTKTTP